MAVLDLFKLFRSPAKPPVERRSDLRLRAALGARVIVVDDSATIRAVLGKMLLQDGYDVLKAVDGESAVSLARAELPDLLFLDIVLPGISGFAVLRTLRRDSRTRAIPIVMMSGNQQATEQFYVQRFGADGFIRKPFGRAEVFHAIRTLVQTGRMPARPESAPVDVVPEGMTQEEWNAIPDIGMPDEAHMVPASSAEPVTEPPLVPAPTAQTASRVEAPIHTWSISAASGAMRPSIIRGMPSAMASGSAPLVVHVGKPWAAPAPAAASDETDTTGPSRESKD